MGVKDTAGDVGRVLLLLGLFAGLYKIVGPDIVEKLGQLFVNHLEWAPGHDWLVAIYWVVASLISGLVPYHFRARRIIERYTPEKIEQMISEWKGRLDQLEETVNNRLEDMNSRLQEVVMEHYDIQRMVKTILKTYPELRAVLRKEKAERRGEK